MRVQLRECNPPRGPWRHNRGRGRSHYPGFDHHRRIPDRPSETTTPQGGRHQSVRADLVPSTSVVAVSASGEEDMIKHSEVLSPTRKNSPQPAGEGKDNARGHDRSVESQTPSPEPSNPASNILSQSDSYREWYDGPSSATLTPPPSSFGSSTSAVIPTSAYPINGAYYAPPPWLHPYAPQISYQIPYFGFPGYPVPGQHFPQGFTSPPVLETSGPPGSVPTPWQPVSMYGVRICLRSPLFYILTCSTLSHTYHTHRSPLSPRVQEIWISPNPSR